MLFYLFSILELVTVHIKAIIIFTSIAFKNEHSLQMKQTNLNNKDQFFDFVFHSIHFIQIWYPHKNPRGNSTAKAKAKSEHTKKKNNKNINK